MLTAIDTENKMTADKLEVKLSHVSEPAEMTFQWLYLVFGVAKISELNADTCRQKSMPET
jgi:hypothetical protein